MQLMVLTFVVVIKKKGRDYLVATTQMINGNTFLEPIVESIHKASSNHGTGAVSGNGMAQNSSPDI